MISFAAVFFPAAIARPFNSDITNITRTGFVTLARSSRSCARSSATAAVRHSARLSAPMAWPTSLILSIRPASEKVSGTSTSGTLAASSTSMVSFGPDPCTASTSEGLSPSTPSAESWRM